MSRYQRGHIYEAFGARFMFSPPARCAGLTSCWSQMGKVGDKETYQGPGPVVGNNPRAGGTQSKRNTEPASPQSSRNWSRSSKPNPSSARQ
jgi:hypothetical protein